jgi:hypothetical protein
VIWHRAARSGGQDWPKATAERREGGLDGRKHGAKLDQVGTAADLIRHRAYIRYGYATTASGGVTAPPVLFSS